MTTDRVILLAQVILLTPTVYGHLLLVWSAMFLLVM
jgi:hypothetical protein